MDIDFWLSVIACVGVLTVIVGGSIAACCLADSWRSRRSLESIQAEHSTYLSRLQQPQFAELEQHFGYSLPASVQRLYRDTQEIQRHDFQVQLAGSRAIYIAYYHPCDLRSVQEIAEAYAIGQELLPIASDGVDTEYLIDPRQSAPTLWEYDAEEHRLVELPGSFDAFLDAPRLPAAYPGNDSPPSS